MTRREHLDWCKKRAHEYLADGRTAEAVASMMSDMQKHEETKFDASGVLGQLGIMAAMNGDAREVSRYIDGFN